MLTNKTEQENTQTKITKFNPKKQTMQKTENQNYPVLVTLTTLGQK